MSSDYQKLKEETFKILSGKGKKGSIREFWDGKVAERIVDMISRSQQ